MSGEGGGPEITLPLLSNTPCWQGHTKLLLVLSYDRVQPWCVHACDKAMKEETLSGLPILTTITLLLETEPPTVFSALLAGFVKSKVKLTKAGALFFLQLSINALPAIATPQRAQEDLRNFLLSIKFDYEV